MKKIVVIGSVACASLSIAALLGCQSSNKAIVDAMPAILQAASNLVVLADAEKPAVSNAPPAVTIPEAAPVATNVFVDVEHLDTVSAMLTFENPELDMSVPDARSVQNVKLKTYEPPRYGRSAIRWPSDFWWKLGARQENTTCVVIDASTGNKIPMRFAKIDTELGGKKLTYCTDEKIGKVITGKWIAVLYQNAQPVGVMTGTGWKGGEELRLPSTVSLSPAEAAMVAPGR